jgi:peptide-methionine (S)-S-oxide reductase
MKMFFGNIFGGGSYNLKIDYSNLDHPGPELGAAAQEGKVLVKSKKDPKLALATFAGGCFWGLELAYQRVPGVVHTAAGYAQGPEEFPNYEQVCAGNTGHTEAIMVYYNPKECKYEDLLDTFFERVDPTTANGQGGDRGKQYRTGVYFHSPEQEEVAMARFETEQGKYRRPIASELKAAAPFWPAEDYHQQYLEK